MMKKSNGSGRPRGGNPQSDSDENGTPLSERLFYFFDIQPRVSNDTRNRDALAIVAAFVRFNTLEMLFTPALDFAIVFNVRTSSFDHARLTTFLFFGISFLNHARDKVSFEELTKLPLNALTSNQSNCNARAF